jgi:hypothetical protein
VARGVLLPKAAPLADPVTPKLVTCVRQLACSPRRQQQLSARQEPLADKIGTKRADSPIELAASTLTDTLHATLAGACAVHTSWGTMTDASLLEQVRNHNRFAQQRTSVVPYLTFRLRPQCPAFFLSEHANGPRISREREGWRGVCVARQRAVRSALRPNSSAACAG